MAWRVKSGLNGAIPITMRIDNPVQRVGEKGRYLIIGAPPNADIYWSSYKDGVATGELNASYGHKTEANGTASIDMGAPWSADQVGSWIKEILITDANGQLYTAMTTFSVYPAITAAATTPANASQTGGFLSQSFDVAGISIPVWAPLAAVAAFLATRR